MQGNTHAHTHTHIYTRNTHERDAANRHVSPGTHTTGSSAATSTSASSVLSAQCDTESSVNSTIPMMWHMVRTTTQHGGSWWHATAADSTSTVHSMFWGTYLKMCHGRLQQSRLLKCPRPLLVGGARVRRGCYWRGRSAPQVLKERACVPCAPTPQYRPSKLEAARHTRKKKALDSAGAAVVVGHNKYGTPKTS